MKFLRLSDAYFVCNSTSGGHQVDINHSTFKISNFFIEKNGINKETHERKIGRISFNNKITAYNKQFHGLKIGRYSLNFYISEHTEVAATGNMVFSTVKVSATTENLIFTIINLSRTSRPAYFSPEKPQTPPEKHYNFSKDDVLRKNNTFTTGNITFTPGNVMSKTERTFKLKST